MAKYKFMNKAGLSKAHYLLKGHTLEDLENNSENARSGFEKLKLTEEQLDEIFESYLERVKEDFKMYKASRVKE